MWLSPVLQKEIFSENLCNFAKMAKLSKYASRIAKVSQLFLQNSR
jgi:hypothetical protein